MNATTPIRRWVGRRLLSTAAAGRSSGVAGISVLPKKLTMPLRRDGLDPLPALNTMREQTPVHRLRRVFGINVWLVSGYDEARSVLADTTSYSTDIRPMLGMDHDVSIGGLGFTDPPEHTRLRKFLTPEFTIRRLAHLQPVIDRIVAERLDAMEAAGPVPDLVQEFAFPIPFLVICELLGLPVEDRERFRALGHARFDVTGGGAGTFGAMSESREFLQEAVQRQRVDPGDGLLGQIIRDIGDEVTDEELGGLADGVFTGGYETSASMLSLGTLALLRDPASYRLAASEQIDAVVDELLRYLTVVQISFPRFAKADMELFGKRISKGDVVIVSLSGANRDSALGDNPDTIDPTAIRPTHLGFGHGFHRCVGAELARMELRAAFQGLSRRYPQLQLAVPPEELQFRDLSIVYGVESLPVRLHPRDSAEA
ncbi:cytochrome P450 [Rudaeicoccus suwonensis]|uniref:Cytochrome P450 n=1 Tax=Rudaeicoccus suwonensis TaxID=657409 RepID=A0A561EBB1_9MICO|nr:cytochrome P450 [Rudaeicoccus suwonensis]TWE12904.1 cytochrome P450 [Rudaeicoccus suwonensis]